MEADAYERVTSALRKDGTTIQLPVFPYPLGIDKIVWSVWDYILGPELMFTWEVTPGESPSSYETPNAESSTSGLDNTFDSTGDGLEFDSDFEGKILRTPVEIHPCGVCCDPDCSGTCDFDPIPGFGSPDERINNGRTLNDSFRTDPESGSRKPEVRGEDMSNGGELVESQTSTITSSADEEQSEEEKQGAEDVEDEGSGPLSSLTFSLSNEPAFPSQNHPAPPSRDRRSSDRESVDRKRSSHGATSISETSSITVLTEGASGFTSVSHSRDNSETGSGRTVSELTSTSSEEKEEELNMGTDECSVTPKTEIVGEIDSNSIEKEEVSELQDVETDTGPERPVSRECSQPMTDERYAATRSLSSEIYRQHMRDSVVDAKMFCVPERSLVLACFSFAAQHNESRAIHSVSLLMNESRLDWYLQRNSWFHTYFLDLVPRIKASLSTESMEEVLSRMTTEWNQLLSILSALEHNPLSAPGSFKVQDTFLAGPKLSKDGFLQRCVLAHLLSMGQTFVMARDKRVALKWERTLSLFTPDDEKWCAILPSEKLRYCSHIKLQGGTRNDIARFREESCNCRWSTAIVDCDTKSVHVSGPYWIQRSVKREAQSRDLRRILGLASPDKKTSTKKLKIELKPVNKVDSPMVKNLFDRLDLLPYDNLVREGFIRQFLRFLAQKAYAFVNYAQAATDSGTDVNGLKLMEARKALDLTNDGDFWIVLPWAERMKPTIAEMIFHERF